MPQPLTVGNAAAESGTPVVTLSVDLQKRVDEFLQLMVPSYRTPSGAVIAANSFFMVPGYTSQQAFLHDKKAQADMLALAASVGISGQDWDNVMAGRGSPSQVRAITQALIDRAPSTPSWQPLDVRKLAFNHAIGLDCAGYVQQAYLYATQRTRAQASFRPRIVDDDLSGLAQRGYVCLGKEEALAKVLPGDIVAFAAPPGPGQVGHRTIVYDQRLATPDDETLLKATPLGPAFIADKTAPLRVLQLDSSWGSSGDPELGGVQRRTSIYNGNKWRQLVLVWITSAYEYKLEAYPGDSLYHDPLDGFYRRRGD